MKLFVKKLVNTYSIIGQSTGQAIDNSSRSLWPSGKNRSWAITRYPKLTLVYSLSPFSLSFHAHGYFSIFRPLRVISSSIILSKLKFCGPIFFFCQNQPLMCQTTIKAFMWCTILHIFTLEFRFTVCHVHRKRELLLRLVKPVDWLWKFFIKK